MSDREVAQDIRRSVDAAGGSISVAVRELRDGFGRTTLTRKARAEIAEALLGVRVAASPSLEDVRLDDWVRLFALDAAPPPQPYSPQPAPPAAVGAAPGFWQAFRAMPAWSRWALLLAIPIITLVALSDEDSGKDGGNPQPAQQAATPETRDDRKAEARERKRERAKERKRARARKRARERARERERVRERRRERRRQEARERRERERAATPPPAEEAPDEGGGDGCDPNYGGGCVPQYPPDVDCPDIGGPYTVEGSDPHGLDRDGDGEACESN